MNLSKTLKSKFSSKRNKSSKSNNKFTAFASKISKSLSVPGKIFGKLSFYRISSKLIAGFTVLIIPMILLGIISYSTAANSIKELARTSTEDTMLQASNYLKLLFQNIESFSLQFYLDNTLQDYLRDTSNLSAYEYFQLRQNANEIFSKLAFSNKDISNICIFGNDDKSLSSGAYSLYNKNLDTIKDTQFYSFVSSASGRLVWVGNSSDILQILSSSTTTVSSSAASTSTPSNKLLAARLIKDTNSAKVIGLMILELKSNVIDILLNNMNLSEGSEIHFISTDGYDFYSIKTDKENAEGIDVTSLPFYQEIQNSDDENGSSIETINGKRYLTLYQKIGTYGCTLVTLIPESSLLSSAGRIAVVTVILVAFAVALALIIVAIMAKGIGQVINRIVLIAEKASQGDLTVLTNITRKDELGFLSDKISSMITNMKNLIRQVLELAQSVSKSSAIVSQTSQEVSQVSHEISIAIQEISQGASTQANDAEQGTIKMSELASKINNLSEDAKLIQESSSKTLSLTSEGMASIEELTSKSKETIDIAHAIISDIQELGKSSESIGEIVDVISKIASQTNLLALNAAIEAARAGEMGRGFSVVASEIRKLAEQTMASSREIAALIKSIQAQTTKTVEIASKAEDIVNSQNIAVNNTAMVFQNISSSMNLLAQKIDQILNAISEMNQHKEDTLNAIQNISAVSEETAAYSQEVTASIEEQVSSIEELASYSKEMNQLAEKLLNEVSRFKIE